MAQEIARTIGVLTFQADWERLNGYEIVQRGDIDQCQGRDPTAIDTRARNQEDTRTMISATTLALLITAVGLIQPQQQAPHFPELPPPIPWRVGELPTMRQLVAEAKGENARVLLACPSFNLLCKQDQPRRDLQLLSLISPQPGALSGANEVVNTMWRLDLGVVEEAEMLLEVNQIAERLRGEVIYGYSLETFDSDMILSRMELVDEIADKCALYFGYYYRVPPRPWIADEDGRLTLHPSAGMGRGLMRIGVFPPVEDQWNTARLAGRRDRPGHVSAQ